MPLLLLPLLVAIVLALSVLLWPVALWRRYRAGHARRRARPWQVRLNATLLLLSAALFLGGAWLAGHWIDAALRHAATGLGAGLLAGVLGLALTRFDADPRALYYTPNRWIVLALTLVVAARVLFGLVRFGQAWAGDAQAAWLAQQGGVLAVGGLVLGYYLAYAWGLRRRLRA